jgi:hypothetical protein
MPKMLEPVVFCHSDGDLIGAPITELPLIVTSLHGDGSVVNGWLLLDPLAIVKGKDGEPKTVMEMAVTGFNPLVSVTGAPYGRGDRNTWHFPEETFKRIAATPQEMLNAMKGAGITGGA